MQGLVDSKCSMCALVTLISQSPTTPRLIKLRDIYRKIPLFPTQDFFVKHSSSLLIHRSLLEKERILNAKKTVINKNISVSYEIYIPSVIHVQLRYFSVES